MKLQELIEKLKRVEAEYGNIEITRLDGSPLDRIIVDGQKPGEVLEVVPL